MSRSILLWMLAHLSRVKLHTSSGPVYVPSEFCMRDSGFPERCGFSLQYERPMKSAREKRIAHLIFSCARMLTSKDRKEQGTSGVHRKERTGSQHVAGEKRTREAKRKHISSLCSKRALLSFFCSPSIPVSYSSGGCLNSSLFLQHALTATFPSGHLRCSYPVNDSL